MNEIIVKATTALIFALNREAEKFFREHDFDENRYPYFSVGLISWDGILALSAWLSNDTKPKFLHHRLDDSPIALLIAYDYDGKAWIQVYNRVVWLYINSRFFKQKKVLGEPFYCDTEQEVLLFLKKSKVEKILPKASKEEIKQMKKNLFQPL